MRKPLTRFAAVLLVGMLAFGMLLPAGVAAAKTLSKKNVKMQDEAWFFKYRQPADSTPEEAPELPDDPTGNSADDIAKSTVRERTNPYPAGTLHVGVNAGDPEALTYLSFPLLELGGTGLDAIILGGTVKFTDAGSDNGSRRAADAEMVACMATDLIITAEGGNWKDRYPYDKKTCAPLKPVKKSDPLQWTLNLKTFVPKWKPPAINYGIAVVPDPASKKAAPDQTWHVSFFMKSFEPKEGSDVKPKPIVSNLKYKKQTLDLPDFDIGSFDDFGDTAAQDFSGGGDDFAAGGGDDFAAGGGDVGAGGDFGAAPETGVVEPAPVDTGAEAEVAEAPAVAAPEPAAEPVVAANATGPVTNPAIWLLPVLGVALAGALSWSLTSPVELAGQREGAVSRLMRTRRTAGLTGGDKA